MNLRRALVRLATASAVVISWSVVAPAVLSKVALASLLPLIVAHIT
jgi:hypothetical protein